MAAKERLQRFFGERREVLMAVSLGPNDYAYCVSRIVEQGQPTKFFATRVHESVIAERSSASGHWDDKQFSDLETAAITADRWYRRAVRESFD